MKKFSLLFCLLLCSELLGMVADQQSNQSPVSQVPSLQNLVLDGFARQVLDNPDEAYRINNDANIPDDRKLDLIKYYFFHYGLAPKPNYQRETDTLPEAWRDKFSITDQDLIDTRNMPAITDGQFPWLHLGNLYLRNIENKFDENIRGVDLSFNKLPFLSSEMLPRNLGTLHVGHNDIDELTDLRSFATLSQLDISENPIININGNQLPDTLHQFIAKDMGAYGVRPVLPTLREIHINNRVIDEIDISGNPFLHTIEIGNTTYRKLITDKDATPRNISINGVRYESFQQLQLAKKRQKNARLIQEICRQERTNYEDFAVLIEDERYHALREQDYESREAYELACEKIKYENLTTKQLQISWHVDDLEELRWHQNNKEKIKQERLKKDKLKAEKHAREEQIRKQRELEGQRLYQKGNRRIALWGIAVCGVAATYKLYKSYRAAQGSIGKPCKT